MFELKKRISSGDFHLKPAINLRENYTKLGKIDGL